jgi:polysaccharide pyruvyl transferase WcaK-like protein
MKKILMSAFIGSRNLGDEAIFKSIINSLDIKKAQITALSVNEEKTRLLGIKTVLAKKFSNIKKAIQECDIMLIGGGGIIQDQTSILNFLYYAFQIWCASRFNKPIILCFVGVGPIKFKLSQRIMRRLIPKLTLAVVRDESSKKQLLKFGCSASKIYQAYDPVLNFPLNNISLKTPNKKDQPYVVVALRRWFFTNPFLPVFVTRNLNRLKILRRKYDQYMEKLASDLNYFLNLHPDIKLVIVSFYDGEDNIVNQDLLRLIKNKKQVILTPNQMTEIDYLRIAEGAEFVVGMRLHSLILAAKAGKPFIALRYSTKVDEFTKQMGLKDMSIQVESYNSQKLRQALESLLAQNEFLAKRVVKYVTKYQIINKKAFERINEEIKIL